ncbi:MAG: hypothetical protein R3B13_29275 [Polyangiaceae bacterium]
MRRLVGPLLVVTLAAPAGAQSLGGTVKQHVDEGLSQKNPPPKKSSKKKKKKNGSRPRPASSPPPQGVAYTAPAPEPKKKGTELPARVLMSEFQLDPYVALSYRGWKPQDYPTLSVDTENAATFAVGMKMRLFGILSIDRAHYESNAFASPRRSGTGIAQDAGKAAPAAAWFLGQIGIPMRWVLKPIIRYEARAFEADVTPERPVRLVPRSAKASDDLSTLPTVSDTLRMSSAFETLVVALQYHHDNDPTGLIQTGGSSLPPIYFGVGLVSYKKPYMVRVGNLVLEDLLFDASLRGAGLAFGLETPQKPEAFFVDFSGQVGLGEVQLTDSFTLNEALPDDWWIGYAQGELTAGYLHPLLYTRPTLLGGISASIGGATFYYFRAFAEEGQQSVPPANWDILWGARVFLVLPL